MLRILICLAFFCFSLTAYARMYQWIDPDSGTTQLSGKPPAWYRSASGGPRIFVFENGEMVDDTGISVPESEREHLRQQALLRAEEDKTAARDKLMEAKRLQALLGAGQEEDEEIIETVEIDEEQQPSKKDEPEPTEQETIDEMRSLIEEWEARRAQDARNLINPGDGR